MILANQTITIFGGSGFIGRYIVKQLAASGAKINVLTRDPESALFLKTAGSVGQINLVKGNISDKKLIEELISQSTIIINAVGILFEKHKQDFINIHAKFPELIGQLASQHKVKRVIHISALGINRNKISKYASSKAIGEEALKGYYPAATIIRPSIVFGAEDNFFNKFASIANLTSVLPLIGGGKTKFQPVYVADIAKAVEKIITMGKKTEGCTYEVAGPNQYSFAELLKFVADSINKKAVFITIPFSCAKILAIFAEIMPTPFITRDQIKLLTTDNVTNEKADTLFNLQIQPHTVEEVVPAYLERFKSHHCYHHNNSKAHN